MVSLIEHAKALAREVAADVHILRAAVASRTVTPRMTRVGTSLQVRGASIRVPGTNAYWLALNDNVRDAGGAPTYPTRATVDETLDAAVTLGVTMVRVHTIGISLGKPRTIMPTLDVYDPIAFDAADYVIAAAKKRGLYLSVPLTDRWDYYHGGAQSLVNMVQPAGQRELWRFWAQAEVRAAFDRYVTTLLNHVNPYTGLRWGDDPTIAMWEVANEFYDLRNEQSGRDRHASTAALSKSLAPSALVVDGTGASGGRTVDSPGLNDPNVDVLAAHYYNDHAMDLAWLPGDAAAAAAAGKVFVVGEYDWTDSGNGQADQNPATTLPQWLAAIEGDPNIAGDFWWALLVPAAGPHRDRYEMYLPPENAAQADGLSKVAAHSRVMAPVPDLVDSSPATTTAIADYFRGRTVTLASQQTGVTYDIVDDGSPTAGWPERFRFRFAGRQTSTFNEYGELRVASAKASTVGFRIFAKVFSGDAAHTANIMEVQDDRNTRTTLWALTSTAAAYFLRRSTDTQARILTEYVGELLTSLPNTIEHRINGVVTGYTNEWGALRGSSPFGWGDALVRAIRTDTDGITAEGGAIEVNDRRAGAAHAKPWQITWTGKTRLNNIVVTYVYSTTDWATDPNNPANGGILPSDVLVVEDL